jgi:hypothetical protein
VFTANNSNTVGDNIRLSGFRTSLFFNSQNASVTAVTPTTFTATVTPLPVGSETPTSGTHNESGSGLTIGSVTNDNAIQWAAQGPPPPGTGTFEVEFEGSGVWDLYNSLLVASVPAAIGAVVCMIPIIGWIVCLICSLIALAIVGIGAAIAQTDSGPDETVSGGTVHPGQDILFVMGRWVLDSAHSGWNELHPVISAQKIGTVTNANLITGNPWPGTGLENPVLLKRKLDAMCGLTNEAGSDGTKKSQSEPQNKWTLHPLVDGCTVAGAPSPNIQ